MSIGYIHLFCDDGEAYDVGEVVKGNGWAIWLEEFTDDFFIVKSAQRKKGERRDVARPLVEPMKLVDRFGLPIDKLTFSHNDHSIFFNHEAWYAIHWKPGVPFPRKQLPEKLQPTQKWLKPGYEGTMVCFSGIHQKRRNEIVRT